MGHIKLEEEIREKLEGREIQPSAGAWEKLSSQLAVPEKTTSYRKYWFAIAAGFMGVLFIVSAVRTMSSTASDEINTDLVVEDASEEIPTETMPKAQDKVQILQQEGQNEIASETGSEEKKINTTIKTPQNVFQKKEGMAAQESVKTNPSIVPVKANTIVEKESIEAVAVTKMSTDKKILNDNIQKVVAQVTQLQKENTVVTAEEIDALLINAQREIRTQQLLSSHKIDAKSLLDDVESDLERSFRDKVYDALGDGFNKIRTAVIDRNN